MTKIVGVNEWSEVTLLEDGDKLSGGEDGLANAQARSLSNRTLYLKEELLKIRQETEGASSNDKIVHMSDLEAVEASLKQSVSDGKSLVAGAITDKGVPTLATDMFQKMADNIGEISSVAANEELKIIDIHYYTTLGITLYPGNNSLTQVDENTFVLRSDKSTFMRIYSTYNGTYVLQGQVNSNAPLYGKICGIGKGYFIALRQDATQSHIDLFRISGSTTTQVKTTPYSNRITDIAGNFNYNLYYNSMYHLPYTFMYSTPAYNKPEYVINTIKTTSSGVFSTETTLNISTTINILNATAPGLKCFATNKLHPSQTGGSISNAAFIYTNGYTGITAHYVAFNPATNAVGYSKSSSINTTDMPELAYPNMIYAPGNYAPFLVNSYPFNVDIGIHIRVKNSNDLVFFAGDIYKVYTQDAAGGYILSYMGSLGDMRITNNSLNQITTRVNLNDTTDGKFFLQDDGGNVALLDIPANSTPTRYYIDKKEFARYGFKPAQVSFLKIGYSNGWLSPPMLSFTPSLSYKGATPENKIFAMKYEPYGYRVGDTNIAMRNDFEKTYSLDAPFTFSNSYSVSWEVVGAIYDYFFSSVTLPSVADNNHILEEIVQINFPEWGALIHTMGMKLQEGKKPFSYRLIFPSPGAGIFYPSKLILELPLFSYVYNGPGDGYFYPPAPSEINYSGFMRKLKVELFAELEDDNSIQTVKIATGIYMEDGNNQFRFESELVLDKYKIEKLDIRVSLDEALVAGDFPPAANKVSFVGGTLTTSKKNT